MSQSRWAQTQQGICNPTVSGINSDKTQTSHPPFSDGLIKPPEEDGDASTVKPFQVALVEPVA
jgi:hypothetical protein